MVQRRLGTGSTHSSPLTERHLIAQGTVHVLRLKIFCRETNQQGSIEGGLEVSSVAQESLYIMCLPTFN